MSKSLWISCYAGRPRPDYAARPGPQRDIWVYDAALALVMAQVIRWVESMPADQLAARGPVTAAEAAAWIVLDDLPVIFRGEEPMDTKPVAELSRAPLYPGRMGCTDDIVGRYSAGEELLADLS
jgi:hypothetical protein